METVLRVAAIYLFVFVGLRVMGKREFGQLSAIELVTLLMIPEIVSQALTGNDDSITNAFVGVSTLLVLVFATSMLAHRFKKVEVAIGGVPSVLVHNGKLFERTLNTERVSPDEIFAEMHKAGLQTLDEVEWAILESDGKIAIVPTQRTQRKGNALRKAAHEDRQI